MADSNERQKLLQLLKAAQQALTSLRAENEKLTAENSSLKDKIKQLLCVSQSESNSCKDAMPPEPPTTKNTISTVLHLPHVDELETKVSESENNPKASFTQKNRRQSKSSEAFPPRSVKGFNSVPHYDGHKELEPSKRALSLFSVLDESNFGTVAKLLMEIPIAVLRRAFHIYVSETTKSESIRTDWVESRKHTDALPELPQELSSKVDLIIKLLCSMAAGGQAGYPFAEAMMSRLMHGLLAENRNQYNFPWVSFFFGNTTGVWHHLSNWKIFDDLHIPSDKSNFLISNNASHAELSGEFYPSVTELHNDSVNSKDVIVETLLYRELQDYVMTYIVLKSATLMESSSYLNKFFNIIMYCATPSCSPGIMLAILNTHKLIQTLMDQRSFHQLLLTLLVQLDDFQEGMRQAFQEIHAIQKPSKRMKRQTGIDWMLSSCNYIKKNVMRIIGEHDIKEKIVDTGYYQTLDLCHELDLQKSLVWQRFGLSTILQEIAADSSGTFPAFNRLRTIEEGAELLDSVCRVMRELMTFDLRQSSVNMTDIFDQHHSFEDGLTEKRKLSGRIEQELIENFQQSWSSVDFSRCNVGKMLSQMFNLVVKPCSCYIDDEMRGWKGGQTGDGVRLFVSLQTRIGNIQDNLQNLANILGEPSTTTKQPCIGSINFFAEFDKYSSYDVKILEKAILLIDKANRAVDMCLNNRNAVFTSDILTTTECENSSTSADNQILHICRNLHKASLETTAYIGLAIVENLLFAILCSMRGLLRHIVASHMMGHWVGFKSTLLTCKDLIISCSALCGNSTDSTILQDIQQVTSLITKTDLASQSLPSYKTLEIKEIDKILFPAFVINLNKRTDRWKKISAMGDRVGLNMIRISAFDGTSYSTTANKVEQAMMVSYDNFEISESDVASTWNTTLNSKFDSGCTADLAVSLTSSEKACAASHLHVWRIIDQLRTQGGTVPEVSQWFKFHDFVRSNLALSKQLSSKESVVKIADDDMDCYLILEDDADCKSYVEINFRSELLSMVKKAALSDWDIIYLGGVTPTKSSLFQGIPLKGGYFTKVNYIWMLHAYLIKGSSITNKLLKCLPIVGPVDNFLATLIYNGTLTAYALGDFIVDQSAGRMSDRLKDSNVVRSGVSASTTVRGYRNILDKRKLSESHEHQDPIDVKRLKDDKLTK